VSTFVLLPEFGSVGVEIRVYRDLLPASETPSEPTDRVAKAQSGRDWHFSMMD
jgi:hypothetical protein